jgi:Hg(II)-responsive transcriptional regulator
MDVVRGTHPTASQWNKIEFSMTTATMTIGRLAKAANVGIETIRYYQRRTLLPQPAPAQGAFRHYPVDLIDRIRFIKRAQDLGFSLDEIAALLQLNDGIDRRAIRRLASERLENIRSKIADLQRMESMLSHMIHACESTNHKHSCPIISALSGGPASSAKVHD